MGYMDDETYNQTDLSIKLSLVFLLESRVPRCCANGHVTNYIQIFFYMRPANITR